MSNLIIRKKCRMCESNSFTPILKLGNHPLVNSYIKKQDLIKKEFLIPLNLYQCNKCKLAQLLDVIDPKEIYTKGKYLYFSSDVPGLDKYFKSYASDIKKKFLSKKDFIIELASNDGIFLSYLQKSNKVLGIDASPNAVIRATKKGIPTLCSLFDKNISEIIKKEYPVPKVILANNCIAHVDDLDSFMDGVNSLMGDDTIFIFETGYWGEMLKRDNYEQIYHDHFCYFSIYNWSEYLKKYKLKIFDAVVTPAQDGCAIRVFISRKNIKKTKRLSSLISFENKNKINNIKTSLKYKDNVQNSWKLLRKTLISIKKNNFSIAGYGASAKGGTISICANLNSKLIDFIVDDSPAKHGLYTPVHNIEIVSRNKYSDPDYFLILAVNYADNIMNKEKDFSKKGGKFIIPRGQKIVIK